MNHRVFERKWRSWLPPGARLSERSFRDVRLFFSFLDKRDVAVEASSEPSLRVVLASLEVMTRVRLPLRRDECAHVVLGPFLVSGTVRALFLCLIVYFLNLRSGEITR